MGLEELIDGRIRITTERRVAENNPDSFTVAVNLAK
jgi:hypothetical protein